MQPPSPSGVGWAISSYIVTNANNSTSTTVWIDKVSTSANDVLDCYAGLVPGAVPPNPGGSGPAGYLNAGSDPLLKRLSGVISSTDKYLACRVFSGSSMVRFIGADNTMLELAASKPFMIVRGCN